MNTCGGFGGVSLETTEMDQHPWAKLGGEKGRDKEEKETKETEQKER